MRWPLLFIALLLPALAGCAVNSAASYNVSSPAQYTLDTGDLVRVTVYGDTTLTNTYAVTDKGTINLPLAGPGDGARAGHLRRRADDHPAARQWLHDQPESLGGGRDLPAVLHRRRGDQVRPISLCVGHDGARRGRDRRGFQRITPTVRG